jgi:glutathione S-transferase
VAIIQYLIDRYDADDRLMYKGLSTKEKYLVNQWLLFQASGQGLCFGQAVFFPHFRYEVVPSAISRYRREIRRVLGVLDGHLEGRVWLMGDKCTLQIWRL